MYLVPTLGAGTSDVLVLYFQYHQSTYGFWGWMNVYKTGYITTLAIIRLVVLCLPLSYSRFTGTRLKYALLYYIFHGISLAMVLLQMLAVATFKGEDGGGKERGALLQYDKYDTFEQDAKSSSSYVHRLLRHLSEQSKASISQHVWILLSLSLLSIVLHILILLHLHSSAPLEKHMDPKIWRDKRQRRVMAYYAFNSYRRHSNMSAHAAPTDVPNNSLRLEGTEEDEEVPTENTDRPLLLSYELDHNQTHPLHTYKDGDDSTSSKNSTEGGNTLPGMGPKITFLPTSFSKSSSMEENASGGGRPRIIQLNKKFTEMKQCLPEDFDDFMSEVQTRLQTAQQQWSHRLNEFSLRMNLPPPPHLTSHNTHVPSLPLSPTSATHSPHASRFLAHLPQHNLSPFRVLLQLFAYEEVLANHRLDKVWNADNGIALTSYVPQLLSFLLHGAFWNVAELEAWILDKCAKNVHFAHRCFWFLRSWCLGEGSHFVTTLEEQPLSTVASEGNLLQFAKDGYADKKQLLKFGSESDLLNPISSSGAVPLSPTAALKHTSYCYPYHDHHHPAFSHDATNTSFLSSHSKEKEYANKRKKSSKFPQEEHSLIEALLFRVMECGEIPAKLLYYDESRDISILQKTQKEPEEEEEEDEDADLKPLLSKHNTSTFHSGVHPTFIPVNPANGYPSVKHLNAVTAQAAYGFLPLPTTNNSTTVSSFSEDEKKTNSNTPDFLKSSSEHHFLSTPRFLDALTTIADDLMLVPRERRTIELRKKLQSLEIELLPSNSIYVPTSDNPYHRVWRIVSDESIALSTKERVPCIVTLEVVDYDPPLMTTTSGGSGTMALSPTSTMHKGKHHFSREEMTPTQSSTTHHHLTESEILIQWYKDPRNPQRHNTILEKVTTLTQQTFEKISKQSGELGSNVKGKWGNLIRTGSLGNDGAITGVSNGVGDVKHALMDKNGTQYQLDTNDEDDEDLEVGISLNNNALENDGCEYEDDDLLMGIPPPPLMTESSNSSSNNGSNERLPPYMPATTTKTTSTTQDELFIFPKEEIFQDGGIQLQHNSSCPSTPKAAEQHQRPPSPASAMGQWSSPTQHSKIYHSSKQKLRKRTVEKQKQSNDTGTREELYYGSTYNQENDCGGGGIILMDNNLIVPTLKTMERIQYNDYDDDNDDGEEKGDDLECAAKQQFDKKDDTSKSSTAASTVTHTTQQRPPLVVFKEDWKMKEDRLRAKSAFGHHPGWRLLPVLVKSNDDLRQEQLASQLIRRMAIILAKGKVPVWLYPYEIISLTDRGGIMEAIPDTISIDSLKRNDPEYTNLKSFFLRHFGPSVSEEYANAKANFVESLAAYSMVCFLLQIKDRHNGNILLDSRGHLIHIDFGFYFLSSPGKNSGFESAPFKLTREFVDLMDGPESRTFTKFRDLCYKTFLELRKHCYEVTLTVEMLMEGNEDLACFLGRPEDAVHELKERFRLDLNDRACFEYVNSLVNESLENWRTRWYDRYQRFCVGVM